MGSTDQPESVAKPLLLALAAVTVCGPWPAWDPPWWVALIVAGGLLWLARPHGRQWWPWVAVIPALIAAVLTPARHLRSVDLSDDFDRHCRAMLGEAERIASDPDLRRLFEASGEALDPSEPFRLFEVRARRHEGRTVYLADDRGRLVAWGGAQRAFPFRARPLGERRWGVAWSAARATLYLREPLLVEGRLVGAVTVADSTLLEVARAWGMSAHRGCQLVFGHHAPQALAVRAPTVAGVEIDIGHRCARGAAGFGLEWGAWLVLALVALVLEPRLAWAVVLLGGTAYLVAPGDAPEPGLVVALLLAGAAVGRVCSRLPARWARLVVVAAVICSASAVLTGPRLERVNWLPEHLLTPGWGGLWMVVLAWVLSGWPLQRKAVSPTFGKRLAIASVVALLGFAVDAVKVPVLLSRAESGAPGAVLPRGAIDLDQELPVEADRCRLDDVAPVLAQKWHLDRWRTPSKLRLVDGDGVELSRWGDLSAAGDHVRGMRSWTFPGLRGSRLELFVASEPWSWLRDWRSGSAWQEARWSPVWFGVFTRSGSVAATLHPELQDLGAVKAGELFHANGGWTRLSVGGDRATARVWRRDDWLVAAVARSPGATVWVLRTAIGFLWATFGLLVARPPVFRSGHLSTFGGRLRLLMAGGVVLPLVVLTLFLHLRLRQQEVSLEGVLGLDALEAARYTAVHLSGGFEVDDDLARWLSKGWGGEVVLFDHAQVAAVSRPDLMSAGVLPELPAAEVFPSFLIGRDDPAVFRDRDRVVAAGAVDLQGRRLLLELIRVDPLRARESAAAVDWLLTGALLAALLALVLTARIESRLSVSLRDLVALARRLLHGEPVGEVRQPAETDLAEVLDAVRSMNEQVQQRELSLRHQEELLRITLSTLTPAVVVLEAGGEPRFSNPSADRLKADHGELVLDVVRDLWRASESSEGPTVETVQPVPGQDLTWRVGAAPVPLPDGSRGLVAVVDDVTDVVRVDRLRQLNQLARIVAHEVKNPLTPVRLWVQELEEARRRSDPELDTLVGDACREIAVQVDRLQSTANSFSNLVALERWQPEIVDLVELVEGTLDGLTILERRGIRVVRDLADPARCRVRGDRQWLQRALGNLVKNSVDAIGDGPGEVVVRVGSAGDQFVTLEVEDTAGGIPEEQLQELFSPHFSTTTSGSGLGLALVHQVIGRCHGRAAAANGKQGLVVTLEIPRAAEE
jgi:signal transduction histidine kinase